MELSHGLVDLRYACPRVLVDLRYAREDNFFKARLYDDDRAWLLKSTAQKLSQAASLVSVRGLVLVVLDAYRPLAVQDLMWQILPDPDFVAPASRGSIHNRGAAVDVTLAYEDGTPLVMPSEFDDFSERASHSYQGGGSERFKFGEPSDSKPEPGAFQERMPLDRLLEDQALKSRDFLRTCMESAGFKAYDAEWWHYTDPEMRDFPLLNLSLSRLAALDGVAHV